MVILNDILDISKLEAGKLIIENNPFHLETCIEESIYLLNSIASQKGLTLTYEIDNNIPDSFLGDKIRIRQILMNLLGNGIKFTQQGAVHLAISSEKNDNTIHQLEFSITDNGIGISTEDQAKLFQPFTQADSSTTRKFGGTGLGLVICRQLVKQMEGEIGVKSSLGKGATFHFTLPLKVVEFRPTVKKRRSSDIDNTMAIKMPLDILVVEDNVVNQMIFNNILDKLGYNPDLAENGEEALQAIKTKYYDVVFMDMQMPVMDGIEATKAIVELYGENRPRIIAMTANVLHADKEKCYDAGMVDFVGKPIVVEQVIEALVKSSENSSNNKFPSSIRKINAISDINNP